MADDDTMFAYSDAIARGTPIQAPVKAAQSRTEHEEDLEIADYSLALAGGDREDKTEVSTLKLTEHLLAAENEVTELDDDDDIKPQKLSSEKIAYWSKKFPDLDKKKKEAEKKQEHELNQ